MLTLRVSVVQFCISLFCGFILVLCRTEDTKHMSQDERIQLREEARDMFYHAYNAYMDNAYPADELMPLSCKGRYRGSSPNRGDIDDSLGNFSLTLIDTLDTLVVLGDFEEFEHGVKLIIKDVNFDSDIAVSVFETNIRVVGGLLSAHVLADLLQQRDGLMQWYKGELLDMAKDVGYRLLPAFNTTTGIPYARINLRYGIKSDRIEVTKETCTACAGSMILEMAALSRLTGEPIFEEKAHKAMDELWKMRHRSSDLMGSILNVHSGDWIRRDAGVGAGIDSYYEYCLKAYILLGDNKYLNRFNRHYNAIMKYISQGPMLLDVHMHRPHTTSRNYMDALLAFWPGLQVLKGDIKPAVETHEMLYQVMQRHKFIPEAFTTDFQVHWGNHPLRPEFLESTYFLYSATGDPYYLDVGKTVLKSLQKYARVPCGYAAVNDVRTAKQEDRMDSFVLAETFKYLYLLFADKEVVPLNLDEFIFTTEAHLFPLTLAGHRVNFTGASSDIEIENSEFATSCPNTLSLFPGTVRKSLKHMVDGMCPRRANTRRLTASQFSAANINHLKILKEMGINIIALGDGRVQLLHTPSLARSTVDAEEGLMFMQEMAEFSKMQSQQPDPVPQVVTFPLKDESGNTRTITVQVGPAQFGRPMKGDKVIKAKAVKFTPFTACSDEGSSGNVKGAIAIIERGECMFIDKVRRAQKQGAVAAIVTDNVPGSSPASSPMFSMSGDGTEDVNIPAVFMFSQDAEKLLISIGQDPTIDVIMREMKETEPISSSDEESMFNKLKASVQEFLNRHTGIGLDKVIEKKGFKAVIGSENVEISFDHSKYKATLSDYVTSVATSMVKLILNTGNTYRLSLSMLEKYYLGTTADIKNAKDSVKTTEWLLDLMFKSCIYESDVSIIEGKKNFVSTEKDPQVIVDVNNVATSQKSNEIEKPKNLEENFQYNNDDKIIEKKGFKAVIEGDFVELSFDSSKFKATHRDNVYSFATPIAERLLYTGLKQKFRIDLLIDYYKSATTDADIKNPVKAVEWLLDIIVKECDYEFDDSIIKRNTNQDANNLAAKNKPRLEYVVKLQEENRNKIKLVLENFDDEQRKNIFTFSEGDLIELGQDISEEKLAELLKTEKTHEKVQQKEVKHVPDEL